MAIYRNTEMIERINKPKTHGKFTPQLLQAGVDFIKESKDQPFFLYYSSPLPHVPWIPGEDFKGTSDHGKYGDVVQEIDYQVGVLLKTIAELGLTDNTLVVFASDNGPQLTIKGHGSPGPLRDGKWSNFEGGIRVPCIMRWPNRYPRRLRESRNHRHHRSSTNLQRDCRRTATNRPRARRQKHPPLHAGGRS